MSGSAFGEFEIVAMENSTDPACATNPLATYTYDPLSRRKSVAYGSSGADSMAYTYSDAGDLLTLNHNMSGGTNDPHYTFQYTAAHELFTEANSDSDYVWQPSGTSTTNYAAANALNQYPSWGPPFSPFPQALGYDAKGNLTSGNLQSSGGILWGLGYDAENRLLTACQPYSSTTQSCGTSPAVNATYAYDPLGRRTKKSGTGVTAAYYLNDGDDEVVEYDSGRHPLAFYVPGPAIDEPIARVTGLGGTLAHEYFHTNHQGSVIAMSNDAGGLAEGPFTYDPDGNCFQGSTACAALASSEPYKFTGRRLDAETGLYYYRARYYAAGLGRFLQTDPVGYTADLNLYTYVGNDPVNGDDPTGMDGSVACGSTGSNIPGGDPAGACGATESRDHPSTNSAPNQEDHAFNRDFWLFVSGGHASSATEYVNKAFANIGECLFTDPSCAITVAGPVGEAISMEAGAAETIGGRVATVHSTLDPIAQSQRTTAVLETNGSRIVAGGARDLTPAQRATLRPGEIGARMPGQHAEVTALSAARARGLQPRAMATSRPICPSCQDVIRNSGGRIVDDTTAVWDGNVR